MMCFLSQGIIYNSLHDKKILEINSVIESSMLFIYFQSDKEEFNTKGGRKSHLHRILDGTFKL